MFSTLKQRGCFTCEEQLKDLYTSNKCLPNARLLFFESQQRHSLKFVKRVLIIVPYSSPLLKRFRCYIFVHFSANKGPLCAWFHQAIITVIVITHYTEQSASSSILYVCVQRVSQFCFLQNVTMSFYGKSEKGGNFAHFYNRSNY